MIELLLALGLILALEGALYAAFPGGMKRMMMLVLTQPDEALRTAGLGAATLGVGVIWVVKSFVQ
ncbi:MAG: DUF2065 domain-containing protein [Alphaproteobacteria bacterium]|jgi:hypothetical protein|nr:DUF2065 domain-containing protein [Alphaproteobacteria bacterium]MDP6564987.1 DUF2065 domain-containing protein [Alphaproteobacteria bacterium]MDP6811789.1 DUF2065 domain-containing protein [Alphaproteobacteria bacterium]